MTFHAPPEHSHAHHHQHIHKPILSPLELLANLLPAVAHNLRVVDLKLSSPGTGIADTIGGETLNTVPELFEFHFSIVKEMQHFCQVLSNRISKFHKDTMINTIYSTNFAPPILTTEDHFLHRLKPTLGQAFELLWHSLGITFHPAYTEFTNQKESYIKTSLIRLRVFTLRLISLLLHLSFTFVNEPPVVVRTTCKVDRSISAELFLVGEHSHLANSSYSAPLSISISCSSPCSLKIIDQTIARDIYSGVAQDSSFSHFSHTVDSDSVIFRGGLHWKSLVPVNTVEELGFMNESSESDPSSLRKKRKRKSGKHFPLPEEEEEDESQHSKPTWDQSSLSVASEKTPKTKSSSTPWPPLSTLQGPVIATPLFLKFIHPPPALLTPKVVLIPSKHQFQSSGLNPLPELTQPAAAYSSSSVSVSFTIKTIKRRKVGRKKGKSKALEPPSPSDKSISVHEQRYAILLSTSVQVTADFGHHKQSFEFPIWTLSQPFTIISNHNQFTEAFSTIFWSQFGPFHGCVSKHNPTIIDPWTVPGSTDWDSQLAPALSRLFSSHSGRGLDPSDLAHLLSKLRSLAPTDQQHMFLRQVPLNQQRQIIQHSRRQLSHGFAKGVAGAQSPSPSVSWEMFQRLKIPSRSFSFWFWLSSCLNLVSSEALSLKRLQRHPSISSPRSSNKTPGSQLSSKSSSSRSGISGPSMSVGSRSSHSTRGTSGTPGLVQRYQHFSSANSTGSPFSESQVVLNRSESPHGYESSSSPKLSTSFEGSYDRDPPIFDSTSLSISLPPSGSLPPSPRSLPSTGLQPQITLAIKTDDEKSFSLLPLFWQNSVILGFISRTDSHHILRTQPVGTFLVRFADGTPGALSVSYVGYGTYEPPSDFSRTTSPRSPSASPIPTNRPRSSSSSRVKHLKPWTFSELSTRSLEKRLSDLRQLTYVYPNMISKDTILYQIQLLVQPDMHSDTQSSMSDSDLADEFEYINTELTTTLSSSYESASSHSSNSRRSLSSREIGPRPTIRSRSTDVKKRLSKFETSLTNNSLPIS